MSSTPNRRFRRAKAGLAALMAATGVLVLQAAPAHAALPTIVNGGTNWIESLAVPKDTNGERIFVTAIVQHDVGEPVTGLAIDHDWNGTDNTSTIAPFSVTPTVLPGGGSNYSAVRFSFIPNNMPQFGCNFNPFSFNTTRRTTNTLRMRAVNAEGRSGVVTASVHSVENNQCTGVDDFPYLRDQSQSASSVSPGQSVTFSFQGDDVDSIGTNDSFDKMRWRVRRLNDGAIVQGPNNVGGLDDNTTHNLSVTFPDRGRYVVEADLGGEDDGFGDFANQNQFFRLGAVDVNTTSGSPTVSLSNPGIVQNTPSGSVPVTITATALDPADSGDGGRAQMIRWDSDGAAGFERREFAASEPAGLTGTQLSDTRTLTGCADRTWNAEVTDNGAMNGADAVREEATGSRAVEVNCPPVAANKTATTAEDTSVNVTLTGTDPDGNALTWSVVGATPNGTSSISGSTLTYNPASNFHGTTVINVSASDGRGGSDAATVTITVTPVDDPPVANDKTVSTPEDTTIVINLSGEVSDVDGDTLTVSVTTPPTNGTATVTGPTQITYDPDGDFNGVDSFVYTVSDGNPGPTDTGIVTINVDPVDDPPVAADQTVTTPEETAITITLGPTTDVDGEAVTYSISAPPVNGSLSPISGNQVTYTGAPNFNGTDSFMFAASDGNSSVTGEITVIVTPVNDAPVADDQAVITDEDTAVSITLTASDVDGDPLTYTVTVPPIHGTLDTLTGPTVLYTPDPNYFGPDAFTFEVNDGQGGTDSAIVSITVNPVNDPPVADDQSVTTAEDTPVPILLTASDVENDPLTYTITVSPQHGTLSGSGANLVYTPALNYHGPDGFSFEVSDGELTDSGTVDIIVTPVNDAPTATPQAVATPEDTPLAIVLTGNDVDGDPITFTVVGLPTHGTLDTTSGANVVYTPNLDYNGYDGFVFQVQDPSGAVDTATVVITVGDPGTNDPPVADDQSVTTAEDTALAIEMTATDTDGDPLSFSVDVPPQHGSIAVSGSSVVYTPGLNYNGPDSFVFRVEDGVGGIDFGTVTIDVTPVNDAPDAIPQTVTLVEDTPTGITLTGTDIDGDALSFSLVSPPSHGTLSGTAPNLTYTPDTDYVGTDFFEFSVADGNGGVDTAVISLNITPAPKILTKLFGEGAVATFQPGVPPKVNIALVRAHLTNRLTGAPIAGKTIRFTAGTGNICTAVTDATGTATCSGVVPWSQTLLGLGYTATFDGDADHQKASDAAPLIQAGQFPII
jgi:hypothetical protein